MNILITIISYLLLFSIIVLMLYFISEGKSVGYICLVGMINIIIAVSFSMFFSDQIMQGSVQLKNIDIQITTLWCKIKNPFHILIFSAGAVISIILIIQNNIHKDFISYVKKNLTPKQLIKYLCEIKNIFKIIKKKITNIDIQSFKKQHEINVQYGTKICINCGTKNNDINSFCTNCKHSFDIQQKIKKDIIKTNIDNIRFILFFNKYKNLLILIFLSIIFLCLALFNEPKFRI